MPRHGKTRSATSKQPKNELYNTLPKTEKTQQNNHLETEFIKKLLTFCT